MPLEMKESCGNCHAPTPEDGVAYICSEECTVCVDCIPEDQRCRNCRGELQPRPRRNLSKGSPSMSLKRLQSFNQAWLEEDVPGLLSFLTDDCVYRSSTGPEPGATHRGIHEVERGIREMLAYEKEVQAGAEPSGSSGPMFIHGHRGFAHWSYVDSRSEGPPAVVHGFDEFVFDGNRIRVKDAFIKTLRRAP